MFMQYLCFTLHLLAIWIDICFGQIIFPSNTLCTTPDNARGNCVRWSECQSLRQRIHAWEDLRPFLCGFAGSEPKVCCRASRNSDDPQSVRISPTTNPARTPATSSENRLPGENIPRTNPSSKSDNEKPSFLPDDCGSSIFTHNRVIGGYIAEKGSFPWMVVVFKVKRDGSKSADCGGALVTARHIVTAAHCVTLENSITPLKLDQLLVRVGVHDLRDEDDSDAMDEGVDALRIHERYDHRVMRNDIAVLRLRRPVPFSNTTAPVCLPYDSLRGEDLAEKSSTITGFGRTSVGGAYSDVLMEVSFDIQDQETCRKTYERTIPITNKQLCAGTLDGSKDSCLGDSGGPLVTVGKDKRFYLVGIVSFGKEKCAEIGFPGVYTRVTEYLDWLRTKLAD